MGLLAPTENSYNVRMANGRTGCQLTITQSIKVSVLMAVNVPALAISHLIIS